MHDHICLWAVKPLHTQQHWHIQKVVKGIGLQRLSLSSEDGSWRDYHFATSFIKIRLYIRKL